MCYRFVPQLTLLSAFSIAGFVVMGYHPGVEDDGVYLAAIKSDLAPALFPHDSAFVKLQLKTTLFDSLIAESVQLSGVSLEWTLLVWQLLSLFLLVAGAWCMVAQLFEDFKARLGALVMLTAMFTLPVAGTALYIADQYLHPRTIASALILFAISRVLAGRNWQTIPLLGSACLLHPLMGAYGASFCCILALQPQRIITVFDQRFQSSGQRSAALLCAPAMQLDWIFRRPLPIVKSILQSRHWYCLYDWTWYEWAGVVGPLVLSWMVYRLAHKSANTKLIRISSAILVYGTVHQALAMVILAPELDLGLGALEPMRYLHLIYLLMVVIGGALLGKHILQNKIECWLLIALAVNGGMFYAQRQLFAESPHLELPWIQSSNPWVQAFDWIKVNTPKDAYFALGPSYLEIPGENFHGFRALAERSALCDEAKDASVVTKVPDLATEWRKEVEAQRNWDSFDYRDFERLKETTGATWVVLSKEPPPGLNCRWHRENLHVCKIQ